MRQATLIAFYGPKPPELEQLLLTCQGMIRETLGSDFQPYDIEQIHATIIGLEKEPGDALINRNMRRYRGRRVVMDIVGFARYLKASPQFPIRLQIGGYAPDVVPFTSRGQSPYERSFSIQGDKAVLIGWPVPVLTNGQWGVHESIKQNGSDTYQTLDQIRRRAQAFNILHAYHAVEADIDNDLYFRLGIINDSSSNETRIIELNHRLRAWLTQSPLVLDLIHKDLMIASYQDEMLPIRTTRQISVDSICQHRAEVANLFSAWPERAKHY